MHEYPSFSAVCWEGDAFPNAASLPRMIRKQTSPIDKLLIGCVNVRSLLNNNYFHQSPAFALGESFEELSVVGNPM